MVGGKELQRLSDMSRRNPNPDCFPLDNYFPERIKAIALLFATTFIETVISLFMVVGVPKKTYSDEFDSVYFLCADPRVETLCSSKMMFDVLYVAVHRLSCLPFLAEYLLLSPSVYFHTGPPHGLPSRHSPRLVRCGTSVAFMPFVMRFFSRCNCCGVYRTHAESPLNGIHSI